MKIIDFQNLMQKEAILNECKGNLFEFLVAQGLAARCQLEGQFLLNLPLEFKEQLGKYEELIRTHEPKLLTKLPVLASLVVAKTWDKLNLKDHHFQAWNVIGKMVATNNSFTWNETDIAGTMADNKILALSLKLTKDHSFTNTKSAGVKSFLAKYFSRFDQAILHAFQNELNHEVDESFLMMGHKLYQMADLEFKGSFCQQWSSQFSELPGELNDDMRTVVHENYQRVAIKLSNLLNRLKELNPRLFFESLYALCGFGHPEIVQINCYHQDYDLKEISIYNFNEIFMNCNNECSILPLKNFASSVEIKLGQTLLQVRVKPMNKFTTAAYKINCSIKVKA